MDDEPRRTFKNPPQGSAHGLDPRIDPEAQDLIKDSPIASIITDPRKEDNPIVAVNDLFIELTGYEAHEILGRNCRFLAGKATQPWITEKLREGEREHKAVLVEILNYKKDGTLFQNAVLVAPLYDDDGELQYFLGSQVDIGNEGPSLAEARQAAAVERVKDLSPRQLQVLEGVAKGLLNKQIAHELGVSERTIKMHRGVLMDRLGVQNVADLIRIAIEAGM